MEGHFPVFAPSLQLSYRQPQGADGYLMKAMGVQLARTTLSLYVTLEPPLAHPVDLAEKVRAAFYRIYISYCNI